MEAQPVDPIDTTWEIRDPGYRVYFWAFLRGEDSSPTSFEWRITGATDVHEVIAWAERERGDRTYELFLEHVESRESRSGWRDAPGLFRLAGTNPADGSAVEIVTFSKD
jgi:hypothetical protein